jgi:hypothetical protein
MTSPLDLIVGKLRAAGCDPKNLGGDVWESRCPVHNGTRRNLSVTLGSNGAVLLHCLHNDDNGNASCPTPEVLRVLGLTMADLYPRPNGSSPKPKTSGDKPKRSWKTIDDALRVVASQIGNVMRTDHWTYHDAQGNPIMVVARYNIPGDKTYRPFHRLTDGSWAIGDPDGLLPLYRLPEVIKATRTVFVVEGEKCVLALERFRAVATTSSHGSGSADKSDWTPLSGKAVVILPDHDSAGEGYAAAVLRILKGLDPHPSSVKVVRLPDLADKEDVVDWLPRVVGDRVGDEAHRAVWTELQRLVEAATVIDLDKIEDAPAVPPRPTDDTQPRILPVLIQASTIEVKPIEWLWEPRVPLGMPTLLFGYGGVGKGLILADLAARTSAGLPRPDDRTSTSEPGDVIVLTAEESYSRVYVPRLIACGADLERVHLYPHNKTKDGSVLAVSLQNLAPLRVALESVARPRLLIIDPPSAYLGTADDHKEADVRAILAPLQQLIEEFNVGLLMVKHLNKSEGRNPLSRVSGSVAWVNAARVSWYVGRDPDNPALRLMVRHKINIAKDPLGLRYSIENCPDVQGEPGRVVWDSSPVNLAADDVIDKNNAQEPGELDRAKQFLDTHVTAGGILAAELYTLAESEGISERTVKRARNRDKTIDVVQIERRWWWRRVSA